MTQVFTGSIGKDDGFEGPAPVEGLPGWTVDKQQQSEIFIVRHGLALDDPNRLQVEATAEDSDFEAIVDWVRADEFQIRTWDPAADAPALTGFRFRAVLN